MFERKRQQESAAAPAPAPEPVVRDPQAPKGRPTPTRKEREDARKRPLVDPAARRTGAPAGKSPREERAYIRQQMLLGNDKYLSPRDQGPERAFLRDCVDSRFNAGEFFLPIMLVMLLFMTFFRTPTGQVAVIVIVYGAMALLILDVIWGWLRARRKFVAKFGHKPGRGSLPYVMMRSIQMRRMRMPLPRVKRGAQIS